MMDRASKLAILASMDDSVLSQACASVGIKCEYGQGEGMGNDRRPDIDEQLEDWNARRVPLGAAHKKEPLWLPAHVFKEAERREPAVPVHLGYPSDVAATGAGDSAADYEMYAGGM